MDKPDVDFIEGLSPAVSIDQKSTSRNPRSTVGTITEVYDYLRLLFARIGKPHCPVCGEPISKQTPQQIVDRVLAMEEGTRFQVLAPVVRGRKGEYVDLFASCRPRATPGPGSTAVHPLTEPPKLKKQEKHTIEVVVDRLAVKRLRQAAAHRLGRDRARLAGGMVCSTSSTCPRTTRTASAVLRAPGLPQRPPAGDRGPRAAVVLLQLAVRRLPRVHRPRHQEGGRPELIVPDRRSPRRGRDPAVVRRARPMEYFCACCAQGDPRAAALPARRRPRLPDAGPRAGTLSGGEASASGSPRRSAPA
jgi:hypothetical protein